jgi:hypothetical protein
VAKFGKTSANILEIYGALILLDNAPIHPCDGPTTLTSKMVGSQSHKVIVWERHELFIERRKRTADGARFGFGHSRILLCGAAGVVVF